MVEVFDVASYIVFRYKKDFNEDIDEMKLHKLLYFAQRESFIQNKEPLFSAQFSGWKYGPILKEIRSYYKENTFREVSDPVILSILKPIMDTVFERYAQKKSWSLSRLTHGELSWQNSRIGVPEDANSDNLIDNDDIRKDAERIRLRRLRSYYGKTVVNRLSL